ncbi:hypothetical protein ACLBR5_12455 [Escherichia coli]
MTDLTAPDAWQTRDHLADDPAMANCATVFGPDAFTVSGAIHLGFLLCGSSVNNYWKLAIKETAETLRHAV